MKIQILIDTPSSWIVPFIQPLIQKLQSWGHEATLLHDHNNVTPGDILVLLSCEQIFKKLELNKYNLVVHESALPLGRGWSPMTWQVLEGKSEIPVTLFEATEKVDAGVIYAQTSFHVDPTDLVEDLRQKQAQATADLILKFVKEYPLTGVSQQGPPTFYRKRTPADSELDINKTILENWQLLQVNDNERYPSSIVIDGKKFFLKIYKDE